MSKNTVNIKITLKDAASAAIKTASRSINQSIGSIGTGVASLSKSLVSLPALFAGAFAGVSVGLVAKDFLDTANAVQLMQDKLDGLTKGRGKEVFAELNEWALTMPVNTNQAIDSFVMMNAMGLNPTIKKMQTLTDVASMFGDDTMPRVARALGQMQTLGKLSSEELNQLAEAGINARKYLDEAFGQTVEEIQASGRDIEEVVQAIWDGMDREFGGSAERAQNSWRGMVATFISYWKEFQRIVMESGVMLYLQEGLKAVNAKIEELRQNGKLKEWAVSTANTIIDVFEGVVMAVAHVIESIIVLKRELADTNSFISTVFQGLGMAIEGVGDAVDVVLLSMMSREQAIAVVQQWQSGNDERYQGNNFTSKTKKGLDSVRTKVQELLGDLEKQDKPDGVIGDLAAEKDALLAQKKLEEQAARQALTGQASSSLIAESAYKKLIEEQKTLKQQLDIAFDDAEISAKDYYEKRRAMALAALEAEEHAARAGTSEKIGTLQGKADKAKNNDDYQKALNSIADEQIKLAEKLHSIEQERLRTLTDIAQEEEKALEQLAEQALKKEELLREAGRRALNFEDNEVSFSIAMEDLVFEHEAELEALKEFGASKAEILEAQAAQEMEIKKRTAAFEKDQYQERLTWAAEFVGGMADSLRQLYDSGLAQNKTLFGVYKAFAVAETMISTYKAAQEAYAQGVKWGGPAGTALGAVMAASAIAAGMAKIAIIKSSQPQGYAYGGLVQGPDKGDRADNVTARLTPGEYVIDRPAVKHYGAGVLEALRKRVIPRELLAGFSLHVPIPKATTAYAYGGMVAAGSEAHQAGNQQEQNLTIANFVDPTLFEQYLATTAGQRAIVNCIAANSSLVKQGLG